MKRPRDLPVLVPASLSTDSGMRFFHGGFCFFVVGWCFKALCSRKGFRLLRTRCNEVHAEFEKRWNALIPVDSHASSITINMYISKNTKIRFRRVDLYNYSSFRMHKYALHGDPNPYEGIPVIPTQLMLTSVWLILPRPWKRVVLQNARTPTGAVECLKDWEKDWEHPSSSIQRWEQCLQKKAHDSWIIIFESIFFWKKLCTSWYGGLSHYLQGFSTVLSVEKIPGYHWTTRVSDSFNHQPISAAILGQVVGASKCVSFWGVERSVLPSWYNRKGWNHKMTSYFSFTNL